jgi:Putative Ig domain
MRQAGTLGVSERSNSNKSLMRRAVILFLLFCVTSCTVGCGSAASGAGSSNGTSTSQPAAAGQLKLSPPPTAAAVGVAYNAVSSVSGGSAPYLFSITAGSLPPGLTLNATAGSISGVPSEAGSYNFTLYVSTVAGTEAMPLSSPKASPLVEKESGSIATHIVVSASGPKLSISPADPTLTSQAQQQFTASLSGTSSTAVKWAASAGTISSGGLFTAPKVTANTSISVTATSAANSATQASVTLTVTPPTALAIGTATLPGADSGIPYTTALSATGGTAPYQWSITSGALPAGIQLQGSSGVIAGIASVSGSYSFSARVMDSAGHSASQGYVLAVSAGSANGFDGPAELPRVYIESAMANTPAPGVTTSVNVGGDLQSALNNANCGDTIQLQAGATFTGIFTFPAKSCDANHWIIVRTSADDSLLPGEGSRLTPCYAGVSSLPGRPALQCAATKNVVAKLVTAAAGNGPIVFAAGANHFRLTGLEITRITGTGLVYALASTQASGAANNIIFDRVWLHGTAQDDTTRGIDLGSGTYFSIVDSFFTDFHCVSLTGSCTDSQTIYGGLGNDQTGPYKIADNFLEASGENILLGGGSATITPADIEISRNHIFKPLTWMKGQAGFVGGKDGNPFIVKNLLELKNAQRVLVDSNLMEDSWGGFSQVGFAILLTPKNQGGSDGTNLCPACQVTDVTIRYTSISHVAAGLQIANALAGTGAPLDGERYSIHDIVADDIDGARYNGPGDFAQISVSAGAPILQSVTINHVTAFPPSTMLMIGDMVATSGQMKNFVFTNSIASTGAFPVWSTGGGPTNCAFNDQPLTTLNACFSPYSFTGDALIGSPSTYPPSAWPSGNFFPANTNAVAFMNYNGGNGGDYQLQSSSPYKGAGTDGLDLGADIAALDTALAGVE